MTRIEKAVELTGKDKDFIIGKYCPRQLLGGRLSVFDESSAIYGIGGIVIGCRRTTCNKCWRKDL